MIRKFLLAAPACTLATPAFADENLFGYVRGAETLPDRAAELYFKATDRSDKGAGWYRATDYEVEYECGVSDRFNISGALQAMSIDTSGLIIDGYLPGDRKFGPRTSGIEAGLPQMRGGGEQYAGQTDTDPHLIEKTKQEARLKIGFNF